MFNRRTFLSAAAGTLATSGLASAQQPSAKAALYANVGPALTRYEVDVANAELIKRETVMLPAGVQYAWPHASRRYLYVASSSSASGYGPAGTEHHVTAFAVDPATGALTQHGAAIPLPHRPIHCSHRHSVREHPGGVQQPERGARLSHQQGFLARRGGEAAGPDRRRHLRPPGAGDARQPARHPGDPRQRRHAAPRRRTRAR